MRNSLISIKQDIYYLRNSVLGLVKWIDSSDHNNNIILIKRTTEAWQWGQSAEEVKCSEGQASFSESLQWRRRWSLHCVMSLRVISAAGRCPAIVRHLKGIIIATDNARKIPWRHFSNVNDNHDKSKSHAEKDKSTGPSTSSATNGATGVKKSSGQTFYSANKAVNIRDATVQRIGSTWNYAGQTYEDFEQNLMQSIHASNRRTFRMYFFGSIAVIVVIYVVYGETKRRLIDSPPPRL